MKQLLAVNLLLQVSVPTLQATDWYRTGRWPVRSLAAQREVSRVGGGPGGETLYCLSSASCHPTPATLPPQNWSLCQKGWVPLFECYLLVPFLWLNSQQYNRTEHTTKDTGDTENQVSHCLRKKLYIRREGWPNIKKEINK